MPRNKHTFSRLNPGVLGGRKSKEELYGLSVRAAEDKIRDRLPYIVDQMLRIAEGTATEHLINHKTGETVEVPVNPATQLKAQQYALNRLGGAPSSHTTVDATPEAVAAGFTVLLGQAAASHWALLQEAQTGADMEVLEGGFTPSIPAEVEPS